MRASDDFWSPHAAGVPMPAFRFGVGAGGVDDQWWHAVDLRAYGARMEGSGRATVLAVCGTRSHYQRRMGQFSLDNRYIAPQRCERCGWVVALDQGTVECEIDWHAAAGARLAGIDGLLRRILTAILADAPPGGDAEPGHRSELLTHATRHRPTVAVCQDCAGNRLPSVVHGPRHTWCPKATLVCRACTFTAGPWAGPWQGLSTGECVVAAPCSVLTALARYYDISFGEPARVP